MDGSQMKDIRLRMGLNQQEFADALGQHRVTIVQYERGFRDKDRTPVKIPKVVELACLALWVGMTSYKDVFLGKDVLSPGVISAELVADGIRQNALLALERRGIDVGKNVLFFPWEKLKLLWSDMQKWCKEFDIEIKMHPVFNVDARNEGIAVLEFARDEGLGYFHLRWTPDVPDSYASSD